MATEEEKMMLDEWREFVKEAQAALDRLQAELDAQAAEINDGYKALDRLKAELEAKVRERHRVSQVDERS